MMIRALALCALFMLACCASATEREATVAGFGAAAGAASAAMLKN